MTVVGVPLRPFTAPSFPPKLALNRAYFYALENAGATVVPIPIVGDVERLRFHYSMRCCCRAARTSSRDATARSRARTVT